MDLPKRKPNRLLSFDYNAPGAYFITICTKDRKCILWDTVGASIARPSLSYYGHIVDRAIQEIPTHYPAITVDHYTTMPNHVHLLLQIQTDADGQAVCSHNIPRYSAMERCYNQAAGAFHLAKTFSRSCCPGQTGSFEDLGIY